MERWIAIVLGLLVIVVGFVVVQNIVDGQNEIVDSGNDFECVLNGGTCAESCQSGTLEYSCSEGKQCCAPEGA